MTEGDGVHVAGREISLVAWADTRWFRAVFRISLSVMGVALTLGTGIFGWAVFDTKAQLAELQEDAVTDGDLTIVRTIAANAAQAVNETNAHIEAIVSGNTERAKAQDRFQVDLQQNVRQIEARVTDIDRDISRALGILEQMNRRDLASPAAVRQ